MILQKIKRCISEETLPHTILFYGPSYESIDEHVYSLAESIIHPKRKFESEKFKDMCRLQLFPDFINIFKGSTGSIKIEEIHSIDEIICYSPYESKNRIIYIKEASTITIQAQNALLKKIEEPPAGTFFILSCNKRNSLIPTIISRSVSIYIPAEITEVNDLGPIDYFPFLKNFSDEIGEEFFLAEKKKIELGTLSINLNSLTSINKLYNEISDISNLEIQSQNEISLEKSEYLKKMIIRMRLAFFSFFIKTVRPDVSMRIAEFLYNQQYFSLDASIFYNIVGDDIGKNK